jgi:hypothetical protein
MQVSVQKKTTKQYIKLSKYNKNINEGGSGGNMGDSFFSSNYLNSDRDGIVEYTNKELRDN